MAALSLTLALLVCGLILAAAGLPPVDALSEMAYGAFGDAYSLSEVLVKMIPLLLCSLAVALSFTMNLWNIGAEGQLYAGAVAASWAALNFGGLPPYVLIPWMMVCGMAGGLLWALGPAILKAKLQVNEIITTLMLNYIALHMLDFFVFGPWKDPTSYGFPMSPMFTENAWLPVWGDSRIHLGLLMGLVLMAVCALILNRTRLGFAMKVVGANRTAANINGMPVSRVLLIGLCLSGAVAGLAGMSEVAGIQHRLQPNISTGYGYTAIIIAWLARLNPWAILAVSFLFGALLVGGEVLQMTMKIPAHLSFIIQALVLFFLLAGDFIERFKVSWIKGSGS